MDVDSMDADKVVSPQELGDWLGVSVRSVREYQQAGLIESVVLEPGKEKTGPGAPRKGYRLQASVRAILGHLRDRAAGWTAEGSDGETLSPAAESAALNRQKRLLAIEQTRKAAVQAQIAETELRVVQGQLLDVEAVVTAWSMIINAAKSRFMSLPSRLPTMLHHLSREEIALVADECRSILDALVADGETVVSDIAREAAKRIAAADKNSTTTTRGTTTDDEITADS